MRLALVAACAALIATLAACGSPAHQAASGSTAARSPTPAASPAPKWCADAHALASEILSTTVLDNASMQTWLADATTLGHEIDKAGDANRPPLVGGHGPQHDVNAALWESFVIRGAVIRAELGHPVGLLKFQHAARTLAASC